MKNGNISNTDNFRNYVKAVIDNDFETWNTENPNRRFDSGMQMVTERYKKEKSQRTYPSIETGVTDWIQGLQMSFEFTNYNIVNKGKEFGYKLSTSDAQAKFAARWFERIAKELIRLAEKEGFSFI